jgi:hypothetical protein
MERGRRNWGWRRKFWCTNTVEGGGVIAMAA